MVKAALRSKERPDLVGLDEPELADVLGASIIDGCLAESGRQATSLMLSQRIAQPASPATHWLLSFAQDRRFVLVLVDPATPSVCGSSNINHVQVRSAAVSGIRLAAVRTPIVRTALMRMQIFGLLHFDRP